MKKRIIKRFIFILLAIFLMHRVIYEYLSMAERTPMGKLTRGAIAAEPELAGWLIAAQKKGKESELREIDTNGNGRIDNGDMTNHELMDKGICNQFVQKEDTANGMKSPWNTSLVLWTTSSEGKGQIVCEQSGLTIRLIAFNGNKEIVYRSTISSDGSVQVQ